MVNYETLQKASKTVSKKTVSNATFNYQVLLNEHDQNSFQFAIVLSIFNSKIKIIFFLKFWTGTFILKNLTASFRGYFDKNFGL